MFETSILKKIQFPDSINVSLDKFSNTLFLSRKNNQNINLKLNIQNKILITIENDFIFLKGPLKNKKYLYTYFFLIIKFIKGLIQNYKIKLILIGIGYRASIINNQLYLKLGFSHELKIDIPDTLKIIIYKNTKIIIYGHNFNEITQFAANIKKYRKINPYKEKGILIENEQIFKKEGKKNKK